MRLLLLLIMLGCPASEEPVDDDEADYDWPDLDGWLCFGDDDDSAGPDGPLQGLMLLVGAGDEEQELLVFQDLRPDEVPTSIGTVAADALLRAHLEILFVLREAASSLSVGTIQSPIVLDERSLPAGAGPVDALFGDDCNALVLAGLQTIILISDDQNKPAFHSLSAHSGADGDADFASATIVDGRIFAGLEQRPGGGRLVEVTCGGDEVGTIDVGPEPFFARHGFRSGAQALSTGASHHVFDPDAADGRGALLLDGLEGLAASGNGDVLWIAVEDADGTELFCGDGSGSAASAGRVPERVVDLDAHELLGLALALTPGPGGGSDRVLSLTDATCTGRLEDATSIPLPGTARQLEFAESFSR